MNAISLEEIYQSARKYSIDHPEDEDYSKSDSELWDEIVTGIKE